MRDHNPDTNFLPKNDSPYDGCRGDCPPSTSRASVTNTIESASVVSWGLNSIASPYPYGGNSVVSAAPAGIRYTTSTTPPPCSTAQSPSPPASSFFDPNNWYAEYKQFNTEALNKEDYVVLSHLTKATLKTKTPVRASCCVRVLPSLDVMKAAIHRGPRGSHRKQLYEMWESASAGAMDGRGERDKAASAYMVAPSIWTVGAVNDCEVVVYDAITGQRIMRISNPKANVAAMSLLHAPFRGFMDRQLKVLPIYRPKDLLRLKSSQLVDTDYVWVGFNDGCIRLLPADPSRIRESDRSEQCARGELADLVFELPKFHSGSIVSIARSPCHRDDEGADWTTMNRLSTAFEYRTAAGSSDSEQNREHLSLMCTASVDSIIVVWDVRKIYQTMEAMRFNRQQDTRSPGRASFAPTGVTYTGEVVSLEGTTTHGTFRVRSSCTLIKVRPLMKLKGGVTGLKTMQWVSSLVTTSNYHKHRNIGELSRDQEELSAPKIVKSQRKVQTLTHRDRREEHRRVLQLEEAEMREVEDELKRLLPPLTTEPEQTLRINLIIAGDSTGTVHIWNLDDELNRKMADPQEFCPNSARNANSARSRRDYSESPGRTSANSSVWNASVASPSVRMSATATSVAKKTKGTPEVSARSPTTKKTKTTATTKTLAKAPAKTIPGTRGGAPSRPHSPTASVARSTVANRERKPNRPGTVIPTATAPPLPRQSKLQILAVQLENPHTRVREMNTTMNTPKRATGSMMRRSPSMPTLGTAPKGSQWKKTATTRATGAVKRTATATSSALSWQASASCRVSPSQSSVMAPRRFDSPARGEVISPRTPGSAARPGRSPGRTKSADRVELFRNDFLTRTSKCRIEFTGGVAINGMAVDVPPVLRTTLRRIPDAEDRPFSLLEEPTPEEVERRMLENSFDDLTEDKALFFVFQQLQLYVAVEGTVLNLRCLPHWNTPDSDGRTLFQHRRPDYGAIATRQQLAAEMEVGGSVEMPTFAISLRKLILEAHSQPVSQLFLDKPRDHVWVGRNDGLLSIFSKVTKKMVTRVPHPCADVALGPPNQRGWLREQQKYLRNSNLSPHSPLHLEWHKETQVYEAAYFSGFMPFCERNQCGMFMTSTPTSSLRSRERMGHSLFFSDWGLGNTMTATAANTYMVAQQMDGRSDLSTNARNRERKLGHFLQALKNCRFRADKVRRAEKGNYEQYCNHVGENAHYVLHQIRSYSLIPMLRVYFQLWAEHTQHFRQEHLMRRQRHRRHKLDWLMARTAERTAHRRVMSTFYVTWMKWRAGKVLSHKWDHLHSIHGQKTLARKRLPTPQMMDYLGAFHARSAAFRLWRNWTASRLYASPRTGVTTPLPGEMSPLHRKSTSLLPASVGSPKQLASTENAAQALVVPPEGLHHSSSALPTDGTEAHAVTFVEMMRMLFNARAFIIKFHDSVDESIIDISWMSIVESAEAGADTDDDDGRRLSVFSYGLLPLLQGLLSTSEDVLPNLRDQSVGKEVLSMFTGIQLCIDYMTADTETFLLTREEVASPSESATGAAIVTGLSRGTKTLTDPYHVSPESVFLRMITLFVQKALADEESSNAIKEVASELDSLELLLDFVEEESMRWRPVGDLPLGA